MLGRLFARWFGAGSKAPPATTAAATTAVADEPEGDAPPILGARRPLVSARGEVAGYEFHVGRHTLKRANSSGNATAVSAYRSALLTAVRLGTQSGRIGFAELPAAALGSVDDSIEVPPGILLSLQFAPSDDVQALPPLMRAWRAAGARLGWRVDANPGPPAGERPDFLVLNQGTQTLPAFMASLQQARWQHLGMTLIANELESIAMLEKVVQAGADYACCAMSARSDTAGAGQIAPQAQRVLHLLNAIVQDAPTDELVTGIKADVSLSYRLLRYLNSASFGSSNEIGSIQQAVLLLGRNDLYRWLSVLLVRVSSGRPVSSALQEVALARSRFLELLAEARGEPKPGDFFTLGMTSMLGELLSTPLAKVVESLQLPAAAKQALLERSGPWSAYLDLAEAVERPDAPEFAALAASFGGVEAVLACSHQAWSFAADPDHA